VLASTLAFTALLFTAGSSLANPRPLPFTYPHEQLAEGATEIEQFTDLTPVRGKDGTTGDPRWFGLLQFQTEFEHGITDRLELGLYVFYAPSTPSGFVAAANAPEGSGMKQRLRYKLAETGAWPIDVSLYGEIVEKQEEFEAEAKVILQRRIGPARIMANVTEETEFYYKGETEIVLAPSAGATVEVTPAFHPGVEWWMNAEFPLEDEGPRVYAMGPHHYVGPAVMAQFGELWWTTGVYLRVSDFGRTLEPGDGFGNVWFRTVFGLGL
ncbi:MAG TPA: hypothetical protein VHE30_30635, partial [Polyangiaceae bacterium]|nr:hypothetical protein [Polyangiaceae bacterium]